MKKIFTLIAAALMSVAASAQSDVQFCYADGTVITDGSVVLANTPDPTFAAFGLYQYDSGVYVKNTSASEAKVALTSNVKSMDSGDYSVCLGTVCRAYEATGVYTIDDVALNGSFFSSMQCHWQPAFVGAAQAYGKCEVDVTLASGSTKHKITILFSHDDPATVQAATDAAKVVSTYTISGQKVSDNHKGLVLRRMSDGRVRKVLVK